ncbi:M56 family metallopeptidase [Saccharopolyspora tripterygii]
MLAAPALGLIAWLGAAGASLTMLLAAGPLALLDAHLWLAARTQPFSGPLLAGCIGMLHRPGTAALTATVAATAAVVYLAFILARNRSKLRNQTRLYSRTVERLGRHDARLGAIVVPYPKPVCFCLSEATPPIVISSGALQTLTTRELEAVLSHERAHLSRHHHALTSLALGLSRAVPLPLFRALPEQIELLLERQADERASKLCGRDQVASALSRMIDHGTMPGTALGATGGSMDTRMSYLLDPDNSPHLRAHTLVSWFLIAVVTAFGPVTVLTLACELSLAP